uniref:Uncharacterized protein n=1 Tax=Anguilla anguilla TaxID=7936 RepID=A0A0E9QYS2_ANGAN
MLIFVHFFFLFLNSTFQSISIPSCGSQKNKTIKRKKQKKSSITPVFFPMGALTEQHR